MARTEWILQRWVSLCTNLGIDGETLQKWSSCINDMYSEDGRHYHTLEHLADMLEGAERDFQELQRPHVVSLATFFHDIVYNPKSGTNEEDSERIFRKFIEDAGLEQHDADLVSQYILATKQHDVSNCDDPDLCAFIDLDMAILGRDRHGYLEYASQIRREYIHVPTETYCSKRAEILRKLLTTKRIYATEEYSQQLEARARANLEAEVAILIAGRTVDIA